MRGLNTIVVGYDFSDGAKLAAKAALDLAKRSPRDVNLAVVTAIKSKLDREQIAAHRKAGAKAPGEAEAMVLEEYGQLAAQDFEAFDTEGVELTFDVAEGQPARVLYEAARDHGAALIVVGAVGLNADKDAQEVGTDTFRLVRQSPTPVLVVRRDSKWPPSRILTAVDLSDASLCAFDTAIELAAVFDAGVSALHVQDDDGAEDAFQDAIDERSDRGVTIDRLLATGVPPLVITKHARDFDLLAIGSIGRGAVREFLVGGTAERVLRAMPSSMLFVKSDAFSITRRDR